MSAPSCSCVLRKPKRARTRSENSVRPAIARASTGCALPGTGAPCCCSASSVCSSALAVVAIRGKPPVRWMPHSVWLARTIDSDGTYCESNCSSVSSCASVATCCSASSHRIFHSDCDSADRPDDDVVGLGLDRFFFGRLADGGSRRLGPGAHDVLQLADRLGKRQRRGPHRRQAVTRRRLRVVRDHAQHRLVRLDVRRHDFDRLAERVVLGHDVRRIARRKPELGQLDDLELRRARSFGARRLRLRRLRRAAAAARPSAAAAAWTQARAAAGCRRRTPPRPRESRLMIGAGSAVTRRSVTQRFDPRAEVALRHVRSSRARRA